ncbi:SDR family NAD(P)-dependent oxidoreductase [Myxococcus fulvus]|uniref:SDR family NAD(P)-dependent oxidoreductase n=1 Tax=Myxococcus fulvus TaxID=33 RepID=UPI003B9D992A
MERFDELGAERAFRVNILAMFHRVRYALPHMKAGGTLINTASMQAYQPTPQWLDSATTKGAIVTFTKGRRSWRRPTCSSPRTNRAA